MMRLHIGLRAVSWHINTLLSSWYKPMLAFILTCVSEHLMDVPPFNAIFGVIPTPEGNSCSSAVNCFHELIANIVFAIEQVVYNQLFLKEEKEIDLR